MRRRFLTALLFTAVAALGPLAWLAHNWWYWGDFLEFYRGPHSAIAIYQRSLAASSMGPYRGDHNWRDAWLYYRHVVWVTAGGPVVWMGISGALLGLSKRAYWPLVLLATPAALILASMHSGGTPIFMPHMWPFSYYNTRFGVTALPALAFAAGALVAIAPQRLRLTILFVIAGLAVVPWLKAPWPRSSICWKESQVNSDTRRNWTAQAGQFMREHYRPGTGILMTFGDLPGVLRTAGIPLRESLYDDNLPDWLAAIGGPAVFLQEEWALALQGDPVDRAIGRVRDRYDRVKTISVEGAEGLYIYRRH
jgi:hypothetical protein